MKKTKQDLQCENCDEPIGSDKCIGCLAKNNPTKKTKTILTTEVDIYNKPIKEIKSYHIIVVEYENGSRSMHRVNTGFIPFELLGLLDFIREEILKMIFPKADERSFSNITRTVKNCKVTEIKRKHE